MKAAFYAGASGLLAHQEALNTIGHNMANVNTAGYKAQGTSFDELLYSRMYVNTDQQANNGFGVKYASSGILFGEAPLMQTGIPTSFAVVGDGLFAVQTRDGQTQYTRNGAFSVSVEGDRPYLVTADGAYVLGENGQRIEIEEKKPVENKSETKTDKNQSLGLDYEGITEKLSLYRFANSGALQPVSSTRYAATPESGAAKAVEGEDKKILSGYVEQSGVSITDEMANMIAAQRSYQLSARVVQTADEVEQIISNLRK